MKTYYDKTYYAWQKKAGEYGANQDAWMYKPYIKKSHVVLDFGCGGGYMLSAVPGKKKYGIDINTIAIKEAQKKGIDVFTDITKLPKSLQFDTIISHHALEHVENPAGILRQLKKVLKEQGKIICVLPIDDWRKQKRFTDKDINKHLYTWTPLLIGNLFNHCGYTIERIDILPYAWIPLSRFYFHFIPKPIYYFLSRIWSMLILSRQIRIIARQKHD